LITGAASGIGRATALCCARHGARLALADIDAAGCAETVALVEAEGGSATALSVDVADNESVRAMVSDAESALGKLDGAFNNAGIEGQSTRRITDWDEAAFDKTIAINLKGVWLCMKHEIDAMRKSGGGAIVNTASVAGLVGLKGGGAYTASKHGVVGLGKTAALEFSAKGIRVNTVCPGVIETPMVGRLLDDAGLSADFFVKKEPIGRLGKPGEIGDAVAWLLSDDSSFVTGVALPVDGGMVAE
jgi:NAD(P)-dependent dehydrogenase (short-subunit alcohol dehydrogenase family)